jgi:hypothetical protein
VEELLKDFARACSSTTLPRHPLSARTSQIFLQFFHNFSTTLPRLEEFGASGLAWGRIVEGIILEELWKHLVNAASGGRAMIFEVTGLYSKIINHVGHVNGPDSNRMRTMVKVRGAFTSSAFIFQITC